MSKNKEVKNDTKEVKKDIKIDTKNVKKEKNNKDEKNKFKIDFTQKKYILLLVGIVILILTVIISVNLVLKNNEYKKYKHYEMKMRTYGFERLYNNGSAKTSESVTKSEAVKMVIGTCLNKFSIDDIAKIPTDDYQNAIWVLYAQDREIVNALDLNKNNANQKAIYAEVIEYFANAKKMILEKELSGETEKQIADLNEYEETEKKAILDMLSNDILKVTEENLDGNKNIFKGQLNEMVVNYIEKYDLLGEKIQTDESKLPSNANDFAYISANVDKSVYEIPFLAAEGGEVVKPVQVYDEIKEVYPQIVETFETYYNKIINVDYETITYEDFWGTLRDLSVSMVETEDYHEYIKYVKDNKIKITGTAKVQGPIVYNNSVRKNVRMKLDFKIESSLTKENLLFYDSLLGNKINYDGNEFSIIIDAPCASSMGTSTDFVKASTLFYLIVDGAKNTIYENLNDTNENIDRTYSVID